MLDVKAVAIFSCAEGAAKILQCMVVAVVSILDYTTLRPQGQYYPILDTPVLAKT